LVPAWLRFLEARQLLSAEQHEKALQDLGKLKGDLLKYWQDFATDPAPLAGLKKAWPVTEGTAEVSAAKEE
jgi:hypothetical protein